MPTDPLTTTEIDAIEAVGPQHITHEAFARLIAQARRAPQDATYCGRVVGGDLERNTIEIKVDQRMCRITLNRGCIIETDAILEGIGYVHD